MKRVALALTLASIPLGTTFAQQQKPATQPSSTSDSTMHDAHAKMNERGASGMGFSQTATTHHFLLMPDGGVIQVTANDSADEATREHIRMHLTHIAKAFSNGDFNIPGFVHDTIPPGVPELRRLKSKVRYSFEQSTNGGRVLISTSDPEALAAIHKFLRFQITEHKTGDRPQTT